VEEIGETAAAGAGTVDIVEEGTAAEEGTAVEGDTAVEEDIAEAGIERDTVLEVEDTARGIAGHRVALADTSVEPPAGKLRAGNPEEDNPEQGDIGRLQQLEDTAGPVEEDIGMEGTQVVAHKQRLEELPHTAGVGIAQGQRLRAQLE